MAPTILDPHPLPLTHTQTQCERWQTFNMANSSPQLSVTVDDTDHPPERTSSENGDTAHREPTSPLLEIVREYKSYTGFSGFNPGFNGSYEGFDTSTVRNSAPADVVLRKVQEALASHAELQRSIEIINNINQNHTAEDSEIASALAASSKSAANIKDFLDSCLDSFPSEMRPTAYSHIKAEQVFATAELCEAIMLYLSPSELLKAVQINRSTMRIFKGSGKLLDMLGLRAHKTGNFSNIFSRRGVGQFPGMEVEIDGSGSLSRLRDVGGYLEVNQVLVVVELDRRSDLKIGSLCRSMFITQPPVCWMKGTVSCCGSRRHRSLTAWGSPIGFADETFRNLRTTDFEARSGSAQDQDEDETVEIEGEDKGDVELPQTLEISCNTGITVGHIYEAVEKLRRLHKNCPHASVDEHAPDGTVRPRVKFAAILDLKENDPRMFEKEEELIRREVMALGGDVEQGRSL